MIFFLSKILYLCSYVIVNILGGNRNKPVISRTGVKKIFLQNVLSSLCRKQTYFNYEIENDDLNWTKCTLQKQCRHAEFQDYASVSTQHFVLFPIN